MRVVALVPDLMFGSRVGELLRGAGYDVVGAASADAVRDQAVAADVIVVDLADAPEGEALGALDTPLIGIHRHTDPESRERALAAGFDLVVPRSRFVREGAELVAGLAGR
jgi:CheY-like chemotaxis protein